MGTYSRLVNWFSATRPGTLVVRHVAAHVDPVLFRWSGGRVTITGVPTVPMLTLMTMGRRTGAPREVQLACLADGDGWLVVASAMGQDQDPAWMLNLRANPLASVRLRGRVVPVEAVELSAQEAAARWGDLVQVIPQLATYRQRTDRVIPVVRLQPRSLGGEPDPGHSRDVPPEPESPRQSPEGPPS